MLKLNARFFAFLVLLIVLLPLACSSDTAPEVTPPQPLTGSGQVVLPAGVAAVASDFRVLTTAGIVDVGPTGDFAALVAGEGPSMVILVDDQDRPVLLGFVDTDPAGSTPGDISAHETATALLFYALQAFAIPGSEERLAVLEAVRAHPATVELASAVDSAVAAQITAITAEASPLLDDIADAVVAITTSDSQIELPVSTLGAFAPEEEAGISIDPTTAQSGILVVESESAAGVRVTNQARRNAWYYVYKTGYLDLDGNEFDVTPPELIANGFIGPTSRLLGGQPSLTDWSTGLVGFQPQSSDPIGLPVESFEGKAVFEAAVAGGYLRASTGLPAWYDDTDPRHVAWAERAQEMLNLTLVKDILAPAIFGIGSPLTRMALDPQVELMLELARLSTLLLTQNPVAGFLFADGQWNAAASRILKGLDEDEASRQTVASIVNLLLGSAGLQDRTLEVVAKLSLLLEAVEAGADDIDASRLVADNIEAARMDRWDLSASVALGLTATRTILTPNNIDATLTAEVQGLPNQDFCYLWTLEGIGEITGFLGGSATGNGATLVTAEPQIQYLVDPTQLVTGVLATIRCEAFVKSPTVACANPPTGQSVGQAAIEFEGGECDLDLLASETRLYPLLGEFVNIQAVGCEGVVGPTCIRWVITGPGELREIGAPGVSVGGVLETQDRLVSFQIDRDQIVEGQRTIVRAELYGAACGSYDPNDLQSSSQVVLRHDPGGGPYVPCENDFDYVAWSSLANGMTVTNSGSLGQLMTVNVSLPALPEFQSSFTVELLIPQAQAHTSRARVNGGDSILLAAGVNQGMTRSYASGMPHVGVYGALVRVRATSSFQVTIPTDAYPEPCEGSSNYLCCPIKLTTSFGEVLFGPYMVVRASSGDYRGAIVQPVDATSPIANP